MIVRSPIAPRFVLCAVATAAFYAGTASAGAANGEGADHFPISIEAVEAKRTAVFVEVDSNGDGLISVAEFDAHEPPHRWKAGHPGRPPHFEGPLRDDEADAGSREAWLAATDESLFRALDANDDGVLQPSEFSHSAMLAARRDLMKTRVFEHLDADGDGYLTPSEFPPPRVAALDADGNGEISRDELRARHRNDAG